ncbi:hypothetical protein FOE78_04640 [Microlunatus elymi]|uniref:ParB-like nuclease domain-containing protein n=1 Tax=Microlunatus elymi TaxID=2596828 RepID=A0A516PWF9_9ACTN|nr:hypothetical protein [Microlunatus elymi]QDP95291.1 hypothetical protein FOE78_04640 [Microlunatus elymi]
MLLSIASPLRSVAERRGRYLWVIRPRAFVMRSRTCNQGQQTARRVESDWPAEIDQTVGVHGVTRAPFPLLAELPDSLRGVILDFHWDLDRLHAVRLPECEIPVVELAWHLQLPFWAVDGRPFQVAPAQVMADPERHAGQWHRTMASDLRYPLDGYVGPAGRITILDGVHRLLKATAVGQPAIQIRTLQVCDFDAIAVPAR